MKNMVDKVILQSKPRGILVGRTGTGKTTLANKLCGTGHSAGAGSGSITRNLFLNDVKCGENAFSLIDTPGTNSSIETYKHAYLLRHALTTVSINTIFIIIKYESRFDTMVQNYLGVEEPVYNYGHKVVVMISHWDHSRDPRNDFSEIKRLFENECPYLSNIICYSEYSSNAETANLMYCCISNMKPDVLTINDEEFFLKFNIAETRRQNQMWYKNYEEKTKLLDGQFQELVKTVAQTVPPEDRDNVYHMLIVQHKNELDAVLKKVQEEHGAQMQELDYYVFYIQLQKKNVQLCDKFAEAVMALMSYSLFDNQVPRNLIKQCPHCQLIWFKTEGCDGETQCGARGFEKNIIANGEPIWK
ncbi:unnamed protein product [Didymodactylos carnosus]|uniref:G domain-containing protein n=1 Tax=Didymodactylos carnosus TaxID=1234261 RepID=A0A814DYI0_9BILA|nr:unnamed protein product [Didymodactylos carnosus]CAF3735372.1 unnamed protein product [Didymodactylos carnosus]